MTEKICRLCLQTITNIYRTIGESTLKTLKLNPRISRETVICTECANYLDIFSNFKLKLACVYVRDNTSSLTDHKNEVNLDPVYETTSRSLVETEIKCSFCAKISGRGALVSLNDWKRIESLVNLLKEMNLKNGEELLTCETCLGALRGLFGFLSKCLEVEEKINKYTEMKGAGDKGQIELKDIQRFIFRPTVKHEIDSLGVNELGERYDQIQNKYPATAEAEIKYKNEINNPEAIIKVEDVGITSELIIKTEDDDIESERISETEEVDIESEVIIKTEDIASELIKTGDVDMILERSDSESFQEPFVEHKIAVHDPLEISVLTSETTPKKYIKQHLLDHQYCSEVDRELCSSKTDPQTYRQLQLSTDKSSSEVTMIHNSSLEIMIFKCELCSYWTNREEYLQSHLLTHKPPSEVPLFKCEFCSYQAEHKIYLQCHLLTHKAPIEVPTVPTFKCEFCSYQAKHKRYLQSHLLTHKSPSEMETFKCELCPFETKHKQCLQRHLMIHKTPLVVRMFKCKLCSYETKRKDNFQRHLLCHKTEQLAGVVGEVMGQGKKK